MKTSLFTSFPGERFFGRLNLLRKKPTHPRPLPRGEKFGLPTFRGNSAKRSKKN